MSNKAKNWVIVLALLCVAGATIAATIDMSDNHLTSGQKLTHTFWNDTMDEIAGGVNNVTTGQITDGTIVNADISATADILQSKIDNDARAIDADKVDTIHASAVATANYLYSLDASAKFPNGVLYTGSGNGLDADKVDGLHASQVATANTLYALDASAQVPLGVIPNTLTGKDADTLDTYDSTAFPRLAAANTFTANNTINATLTATELYLVNSATQIYKDGSNNLTFKDAVVSGGSKTLTQLATDSDSTHHYAVDGIAVGGAGPVYTTVNSGIDWRSRNICILVYKSDSAWSTTAPTVSAGTNPFYIPLGNSGQTFELNISGASVLLRANSTSGNLEWGGGGWNTASMLWIDLTK